MRTHIVGRRITDLPLPGDEGPLLDHLIRRAIRRDNRLNTEEITAALCVMQQINYALDGYCLMVNCTHCGGL